MRFFSKIRIALFIRWRGTFITRRSSPVWPARRRRTTASKQHGSARCRWRALPLWWWLSSLQPLGARPWRNGLLTGTSCSCHQGQATAWSYGRVSRAAETRESQATASSSSSAAEPRRLLARSFNLICWHMDHDSRGGYLLGASTLSAGIWTMTINSILNDMRAS
jgi:hypothetical protein